MVPLESERARKVDETYQKALYELKREAWREGVEYGLKVAEQIRAWLTRRPDRKWQAEVRTWADKAIADARAHVDRTAPGK